MPRRMLRWTGCARVFPAMLMAGVIAASPRLALGGENVWTTNGPVGGVWRSKDSGHTWKAINTGFGARSKHINALAVDRLHPATLYAGTDAGVFKTRNGGGVWAPVGIGSLAITAVAVDPSSSSTVYAVAWGTNYARGGVFKSTDGGGTWKNTTVPEDVWEGLSIAISPSAPSTVYAVADGLYTSTNGGASWRSVDSRGLPPTNLQGIVVDPLDALTVYVCSTPGAVSGGIKLVGGVFRSTDGGDSWRPLTRGLTNRYVQALALDPLNPRRLYAGTDGGGVFSIDLTDQSAP